MRAFFFALLSKSSDIHGPEQFSVLNEGPYFSTMRFWLHVNLDFEEDSLLRSLLLVGISCAICGAVFAQDSESDEESDSLFRQEPWSHPKLE